MLGSSDPTDGIAEPDESAADARAYPVFNRSKSAAAAVSCSRSKYCFREFDADNVSFALPPLHKLSVAPPKVLFSKDDDVNWCPMVPPLVTSAGVVVVDR